ncbi:MBL fold metallo-hydrolase [Tepidiforma sp.]|uniref:MBL fold metallo-hydrolase n=1 Tax=Tepidiforma sp. TaxID=2682230 RepID=UPI002ADD6B68|nr:MBL fold metallo-hydrolase [Tepidiforma sp.]
MEPLPDQPLPGVCWLHGTRGSNVYLVRTGDGLALIDTGFADSAPAILRAIQALALPLHGILLTHRHRDHTGAAAAIAAATGAPIIAGAGDCRLRDGRLVLRSGIGRTHPLRIVGAFLRRRPAPVPVAVAVEAPAEVLPGIRAIPVPGHTPGSLCFVTADPAAAFVGDLVISHNGELTRSLRWANHDDARYLQSIRDFAEIAPPAGFPGHGTPILQGFDASLRVLAELPRRPLTPRTALERTRRLAAFSRMFAARRLPGRQPPPQ